MPFVIVFFNDAGFCCVSGGVPEQVVGPYRTGGGILLGTFGLCLFAVLVCLIWLVGGGPEEAYGVTVGLFVLELAAVFGARRVGDAHGLVEIAWR